jgi:hypothetical protein
MFLEGAFSSWMLIVAIGTIASTLASLMTFLSTTATSLHIEVI